MSEMTAIKKRVRPWWDVPTGEVKRRKKPKVLKRGVVATALYMTPHMYDRIEKYCNEKLGPPGGRRNETVVKAIDRFLLGEGY